MSCVVVARGFAPAGTATRRCVGVAELDEARSPALSIQEIHVDLRIQPCDRRAGSSGADL